jgi:hypothetical protein
MPKPRKPTKPRPRTRRERHAALIRKIDDERKRHRDRMSKLARALDAARQIGAHDLVSATYRKRTAEHDRHMAAIAKLEKRAREV